LSQRRPSKAALLKFFAAFANDGDGIDGATDPAANIGQVGQDAVQTVACGSGRWTLATFLATLTQKRCPEAAHLALLLKYRYGDSNPGFRTENWL